MTTTCPERDLQVDLVDDAPFEYCVPTDPASLIDCEGCQ